MSFYLAAGAGLTALSAGALYLYLRTITKTPVQDVQEIRDLLKTKKRAEEIISRPSFSITEEFDATAQKYPNREALMFIQDDGTTRTWTFTQLIEYSNQVAHWAQSIGIKHGDVVGLMLNNCPEFIGFWLGLGRLGATTALFNIHLRGTSLAACIKSTTANIVLVEDCFVEELKSPDFKSANLTQKFYSFGKPKSMEGLEGEAKESIESQPKTTVDPSLRSKVKAPDPIFLIFTSGTTGLPKAAKVQQTKIWGAKLLWQDYYPLGPGDRFYSPLPLYHSAANVLAVGTILTGSTLVFRKKFSASHFWSDVVSAKASAVQYIGEIARYLLNSPVKPEEKQHNIRFAFGNGLRADIWREFKTRFNIPQIAEFYAATEGNVQLWNRDDKEFSIGRIRPLVAKLLPYAVVKFDIEKEQPIRDKNGFCIRCKPNEPGELIGMILQGDARSRFDGYTDKAATEKKILRDVFKKGDQWFRSGDLLYHDVDGYFYWSDRIGDTFRWKGENVSTSEVENFLSKGNNVKEIVVYGVEVPHHDGRAGMGAITLAVEHSKFDFHEFFLHAKETLPRYAIPLFLRVVKEMEVTGTFKYKKSDLKSQAFELKKVPEPLYFINFEKQTYEPLTEEMLKAIHDGSIRL